MRDDPEIIIERVVVGRYVRVTAIDAATGHEVTVVGDANQPPELTDAVAARKLMYQLKKLNLQ